MDIFHVLLYVKFSNLSKIIFYESRGLSPFPLSPLSPLNPSQKLLQETKPSYVYSTLKSYGQSDRRPVKQLLHEAKLSYVY